MKRNTFLKSLGLLAVGIVSGNKIFGAANKNDAPVKMLTNGGTYPFGIVSYNPTNKTYSITDYEIPIADPPLEYPEGIKRVWFRNYGKMIAMNEQQHILRVEQFSSGEWIVTPHTN